MHLLPLTDQLQRYRHRYPEESETVRRFIEFISSNPDCLLRSNQHGHLTGSAWIIDASFSNSLLIHHRKLEKWLQPGGHADGCEDMVAVARNEGLEETGVSSLALLQPDVFDLDIHTIPARKSTPAHLHYDVRYLFRAREGEENNESSETNEVRWWSLENIEKLVGENASILRLIQKTRALSGP